VLTDAATAAALGTNFDVRVTPTLTTVTVISGLVRVRNKQGSVLVRANQQTAVAPGQKPQPPVPVNGPTTIGWTHGMPSPTPDFILVPSLTKVTNPNAPELTINAASGIGVWDHPRDGGQWKVTYTFTVPQTITPGTKATVTVGIEVSNVNPEQPILFQMGVRAPDFAQAFDIHYPNPASGSKTFTIPISASYSAKELTIIISFVSAEVDYVYRRT
jgi:hypothetical protein